MIKQTIFPIFLLMASALSAQTMENPGTPEERATRMTQEMTRVLALETHQLKSVYELNLKYAQIGQKEIIDKKLNMWSAFMKGYNLNSKKEKELKSMLSASQWKRYLKEKPGYQKKILKAFFD
ncbi:MAG: hypothetical protein MRZ79_15125 [Bacteroidia bacterium]|nr:hypothetical protein [Bacteroidia bacterium]